MFCVDGIYAHGKSRIDTWYVMTANIFYYIALVFLTIPSWGFVDSNNPLPKIYWLHPIIYFKTIYPTIWYTVVVVALFGWYIWTLNRVRKGHMTSKNVWYLIVGTVAILIWSYPALSNDIFNYIATAKVSFLYRENPYVIMPIDIPSEPMFRFLHAANKVALYGPAWIALTAIPHYLGMGNLFVTLFTFKFFVIAWYLLLCFLIWSASGKKAWPLAFFALNPLVLLSTLVDGHNDVVMMALVLGAFLLLKQKRYVFSLFFFIASILIKGATLFLIPVFVWSWLKTRAEKNTDWQPVWYWASISMYVIFFLSPLREEMYAWYFIWPLTFLALVNKPTMLHRASYGFSLGLMLRIVPFFYTRSWSGMTPLVKKIVTFVPPAIAMLFYGKTTLR